MTLPVGDVDHPAKSKPGFVNGPVFPGREYAVPAVVKLPFAGTDPEAPLALNEIT